MFALKAGISRKALSVRANAAEVPANVVDARRWIGAWKSKSGSFAPRDPKLPHWFPGTMAPSYLDGTMTADFGFDPLGLGRESEKLAWYMQAELVHCRFAMLGVAGCLFPELLASAGLGGPAAATPWFKAGQFEYFASPSVLLISTLSLFLWVETRRLQDIRRPGSVSQDPIFSSNKLPAGEVGYPGGIFDPMGFAKGNLKELKLKEIKNGRLAMLAFVGFWAASVTTGKTPLAALGQHLSNPWSNTVLDVEYARLAAGY